MRRVTPASRRDGFSLLELMVVIAIMAVLAALTAAGIGRVRAGQQARNTDETVTKLQKGLNQQITAVVDEATRDNNSNLAKLIPFCGNKDRAKALLTYMYLRREFPQTIAEASSTIAVPSGSPVVVLQPMRSFSGLAGAAGLPADQQSAILLYAILQEKGNRGQVMPVEDGTTGAQDTINGFKVFKDAYGTHIAFQRWLEFPPETNNAPYVNPKAAIFDPFDPLGMLTGTWPPPFTSNRSAALTALQIPNFDGNNKMITVQSAGQDKVFGTPADDDVFGYRLARFGNKGN